MNERRAEKVRALAEERERRLAIIAVQDKQEKSATDEMDGEVVKEEECWEELANMNGGKVGKKKRKTSIPLPDHMNGRAASPLPTSSIFGPISTSTPSLLNTPRRTNSPALGGLIRPGLGLITRPLSPRRLEKRRSVYSGVGEYSPGRGRGTTWTPPRILPSGDETAPIPFPRLLPADNHNRHSLSDGMEPESTMSVPSSKFDFVSPLGPVHAGRLSAASGLTMTKKDTNGSMQRRGSSSGLPERELDPVKEEDGSEEDGWTIVSGKNKGRKGMNGTRAGSAPCGESKKGEEKVNGMEEDIEL